MLSVCVATFENCVKEVVGIGTADVKFSLATPVLSYALIMYVPDRAGTVNVVAGLGTFSVSVVAFAHVAPDTSLENLIA